MGGFGDRDGREFLDIAEGDRDDGKEDKEALRLLLPGNEVPFEVLEKVFESGAAVEVSVVEIVPRVVGRCISAIFLLVSFVVR